MPSYRVRMVVGDLHADVDPADVLPAAVATARERTAVEAGQVEVVRGRALLTVRFQADDDVAAAGVGRAVVARVDGLVVVETSRVTRRSGQRWSPMRSG